MAGTSPPPEFPSPSERSRAPSFADPAQAARWAGSFIESRTHEPLSTEAVGELRDRLESGYDTLSTESRLDEYSAFVGHYVDRLTSRMSRGASPPDPARTHTGDGGGYLTGTDVPGGVGGGGGGNEASGDVRRPSDPVVRSMRAICPMWPFC